MRRLGAGGHHDSLARAHTAPHCTLSPKSHQVGKALGFWQQEVLRSSPQLQQLPRLHWPPPQRIESQNRDNAATPSQAWFSCADGNRNVVSLGRRTPLSSPGLSKNSWLCFLFFLSFFFFFFFFVEDVPGAEHPTSGPGLTPWTEFPSSWVSFLFTRHCWGLPGNSNKIAYVRVWGDLFHFHLSAC